MSCISQILKLKGDQEALLPLGGHGKPWIAVEGGGDYKEYEYLIVLTPMGHRCGYVAIPPEHPFDKSQKIRRGLLFMKGEEVPEYDYDALDITCHGGLTFMKREHGLKKLLSIPCDDIWIGFDCAHCYDIADCDAYEKYFKDIDSNLYLTIMKERSHSTDFASVKPYTYVEEECKSIIDQLIKVAA